MCSGWMQCLIRLSKPNARVHPFARLGNEGRAQYYGAKFKKASQ
jgi:hypothetical protein